MVVVPAEDVTVPGEAGNGVVQGAVAGHTPEAAGVPLALHRPQIEPVDDATRTPGAEGHLAGLTTSAGNSVGPSRHARRPWGPHACRR